MNEYLDDMQTEASRVSDMIEAVLILQNEGTPGAINCSQAVLNVAGEKANELANSLDCTRRPKAAT